jgi:hypothetical protein
MRGCFRVGAEPLYTGCTSIAISKNWAERASLAELANLRPFLFPRWLGIRASDRVARKRLESIFNATPVPKSDSVDVANFNALRHMPRILFRVRNAAGRS